MSEQSEGLRLEPWSTIGTLEAHVRVLLRVPYNVQQYGGLMSQVRERYWRFVRRYDGELCQLCARPYPESLWGATDRLWSEVVGIGLGLLCPCCFGELAEEGGVLLKWKPVVLARRDSEGAWNTELSEDRDEVEQLWSMRGESHE
jgi:hypothetical protein